MSRLRTFQINIQTLFLFLLFISCIILTIFIYEKNKDIVFDVSDHLMTEESIQTTDHLRTLLSEIEKFADVARTLVTNTDEVTPENKKLTQYLFAGIKVIPDVTILRIVTKEGTSLGVYKLFKDPLYRSKTFAHLPKEYAYAIQFVDRRQSSGREAKMFWTFLDENGNILGTKEEETTFDARTTPWYQGAEKEKSFFWTHVYQYQTTDLPGISVGYPIFNKEGEFIGVSGGELELIFISRYLSQSRTAGNGQSMIMTEDGAVVAAPTPEEQVKVSSVKSLIPVSSVNPLFAHAYEAYKEKNKNSFIFEEKGQGEYLASFTSYISPGNEKWLIAVVLPAKVFLAKILETQKHLYLIFFFILLAASILVALFAKKISRPIVLLSNEVDAMRNLDFDSGIEVKSHIREINLMKNALASMKSALQSFGRYVPKPIVKKLLEKGHEIRLGGKKEEITIFFSDIYNFTTISETLPTEKLMDQLNTYFELLSDIILQNGGTIDKYIGDSIMAFWGAPTPVLNHTYYACHTALLCQFATKGLNESWVKDGKLPFDTRIGLHVGKAIVGNIGTIEHMNYTMMGDAVNLASRFETTNKEYQTHIIVSEDLKKAAEPDFLFRPLEILDVKGKAQKIKIYELLGEFGAEDALCPTKAQVDFCNQFEQAFQLFQENKKQEALKIFELLHEKFPQDYPTMMYINRCK